MLPLYAARIEDLGPGDFVKVDCAACHHVALLTPEALLRVGLSRTAKVLDLKGRFRCRACGRKGRAVGFDQVARAGRVSRRDVAPIGTEVPAPFSSSVATVLSSHPIRRRTQTQTRRLSVLGGSQLRLSPLRNGAISYGAFANRRVRD